MMYGLAIFEALETLKDQGENEFHATPSWTPELHFIQTAPESRNFCSENG